MNKDVVLREHLAVERTKMSNERTLLSYVRTGLYFVVAGSTLGYVVDSPFWDLMGWPLMIAGVFIGILGGIRFRRVAAEIRKSKKNIGNASSEFINGLLSED